VRIEFAALLEYDCPMDSSKLSAGTGTVGKRDGQSVGPGGVPSTVPKIAGVRRIELGNVLTRSGTLLECFRRDWPDMIVPQQVNWVQLNANGVTDWHKHDAQTDHLVGVSGNIRLALWDDRPDSPTYRAHEIFRLGALRPAMIIVPPGIWHGLRNESGEIAGYINCFETIYDYADPDSWRLPPGTPGVPDIL
jgi:dTDP-4-dehydrorhamnose 3,5-epimerase